MTGEVIGLAAVIIAVPVAYLFWQISRLYRNIADTSEREETFIQLSIDKVAKKKGIDIEKEIIKRDIFRQKSKSIRQALREEIMKDLFNEKVEE